MAWWIPAAVAGVKGIADMWGAGEKKGAAQKAGRDKNQARVKAGKAQVRMAAENISHARERAIETRDILIRNTGKQIDLSEANLLRSWGLGEELRFDDYRRDSKAFNQSVEDYYTDLNFNDISANMAYQEEKNFMKDFHIGQEFEKKDDILEHEKILQSDITSQFSLRRQQEAFRSKSAFDDQQDIIKGLMVAGKIRSTGVTGRSARKAVQVAAMDVGSRQAMRADALMNSNSVYYNEMKKLANVKTFAEKTRNLNIDKRAASLKSMLKASTLRKDRIAANKYSADLQAQRRILPEPELDRMTPVPFELFRPEFQEVQEFDRDKFYDDHMPSLSDENKIYGDRGAGAPSNPWMDVANVGLDMAGAADWSKVFGGGGGGTSGLTGETWNTDMPIGQNTQYEY